MTLEEFNSKYIYQSDKSKFGRKEVWGVPELDKDGKYRADCESYMLFLVDNKLIPKETKLYYCKVNGIGHCVGYVDGKIIDCNNKKFEDKDAYAKRFNMTNFSKYGVLCIWYRRQITKVVGYVPFI